MKIALLGYGKMGKTIETIALERGHEINLKVNADNLSQLTKENLQESDVAIEFSTPQSAYGNILKCFEANTPIVVGTTAWLDKLNEIKQKCLSGNHSFFYASNFSIGVNIFFELNKKLAQLMNNQTQYKVAIDEDHHTEKLDSPSGTAITLAEGIIGNLNHKEKWINNPSNDENILPIISHRNPGVPGTHTIKYNSEVDFIEITHQAHSRKGFAEGSVLAAEWLVNKKGFFTMADMLKF